MKWSFFAAVAGGIGSLAIAWAVTAPQWVYALVAAGGFFGLGIGIALGAAVRALTPTAWIPVSALVIGVSAALTRAALVAGVGGNTSPSIDFWQVQLASASVAWGALAMSWGGLGISDALERRAARRAGSDSGSSFKHGALAMAGSAMAVVLALYSVAPLGRLVGLRVNHWTLLGLFAVASVAYFLAVGCRVLASVLRRPGGDR